MSLDVAVANFDEDLQRGVPRSLSVASSEFSQQQHHSAMYQHHASHNLRNSSSTVRGETKKYQYVPYKNSLSSSQQSFQSSQSSLASQHMANHVSTSQSFVSQGMVPQRPGRAISSSYSQNSFQHMDPRRHGQIPQNNRMANRHARSTSLKASNHHAIDCYEEFSDAYYQFNNHTTSPSYQRKVSSSSSDSLQDSPHQLLAPASLSPRMPQHTHLHSPANGDQGGHNFGHQSRDHVGRQQPNLHSHKENVQDQELMIPFYSNGQQEPSTTESPYRSTSRHTYVKSKANKSRKASSSESSFASSIKCCVGVQAKKKYSKQRVLAHQLHQKQKERERLAGTEISLASIKSHQVLNSHMHHGSPSHSTVSCPYTVTQAAQRASRYNSSGYSSEVENSKSNINGDGRYKYDSDSDFSDSEFARATAGSRGKSAGTVMMKLAKKFSKRNLPITRDDDDESLTNENERSSWRMKHRSNSVSNLDSLEGLTQRSQSMEHLAPFSVDQGRSSGMGSTPQGSPRMVRSWSKGKLNRRSADFENENAFSRLSHSGSRKNLSGNPVEDLFEAIELGNVEAVSSLIEANVDTKFNIVNEDEFLPVDLSVMLGYHMIAQILLANGAKDSPKFCRDPTFRLSRIKTLINEAERDLYRLKGDYISQNATNNSGIKDAERRYKKGEMRVKLYRHMLNNYESARVPGPPTNVHLHVTSNRSLMVTFSEPNVINHATVTRYKIEWCRNEEFRPVVGDFVMTDLRTMEYVIPDLDKGEKYYVRVSAYNMKGFGPSQVSDPPYAVPSSWHDINNTLPRYEGCTDKIHVVSAQFGLTVQNTPTMPPLNVTPTSTPIKARPIGRRGTNPLTRMFSSTVKFHKSLRPGVFITSLVYSDENKILITADDNIPIVEVSDSTSSSIGSDFVWMANLACTWEHVQAMCDISDGYTSSPAVHFRNKLLHAILDLQNSLGITDLGLLHPVPYKDSYGAIVFVIVRYLQDTKNVPTGNSSLRWIDLSKLWKRRTAPNKITGMEAFPVPDQIVLDAQEIIAHNYSSTRPLEKGLYLGYLKARSSVASMKIICSREYPNVLPHIKLRDNPNLNSEEWEWIKSLQYPNSSSPLHSSNPFSLQRTLLPAIDLFLKNLGFNKEEAENHQLYIHEAIELNENTTILLLLPPHEHVCTAPGSSDHFANLPDFVALPINTFEIMQLYTYQRSFMTKFSMVSTRLEVELLASHQQMREAFSKAEVAEAREKKSTLESFNSRTEQVWKQMRWIEDAVQKGRDHQAGSDDLLPISIVRQSIERQKKELSRSREEGVPPPVPPHRRKSITSINGISGSVHSRVNKEENVAKKSGYLRVIPSYQTGLARGTSVKLYIENTTTTLEVISLVVNQVAKATIGSSNVEFHEQDLSDFYLVAGIRGRSEWTLEPNYHPLQLQLETGTTGKVYLLVKRRSEENQLNQLITSV